MDIRAWLGDLGLERYAQAFADHDVDAQTLPQLNEADLAAIGVSSVGHRRKLIDAIAALEQGTVLPEPPDAAASGAVQPLVEHRQLTVLCCGMAGPTALSAELDLEDLREAIRGFHGALTPVVAEFGGHVANLAGDRMLAYFGWPRAHEDDAERAVRAGLAMVQAAAHLQVPAGGNLAARVGIATGPVVVGDIVPEGPARERPAIGAAPERSGELHALAAPGQVVIDELTRLLLAQSFALRPLPRHALERMEEAAAAYAVDGERPVDSRFDARRGGDLPPMIGRDQELELLQERWARAQDGEGQAVLLLGEAGLGKSRLARALLDACAVQPHWRVRWQCSPYHTGSALWPVIQQLTRSVGLLEQDSADAALDKLEAVTRRDREGTALYAKLLGLNGSQRYGPLEMVSQTLRVRTMELLVGHLFEMAVQRPVLLVVEDAHWIDPTTLELLERCVERIESARMLVLITSRANLERVLRFPSITQLSLNRLSRAGVEAIVAQLGGESLQLRTRAAIVAQSDGVPLFAEELTKAAMETGEAAIPASLHGTLMARLDHIPEVKPVAQIAACIGREFDQALVCSVAERCEATAQQPRSVGDALDKLAAAELVLKRGDKANPRFAFKHALVQEAAYESVLRSTRRSIHGHIFEALAERRPDTAPEILAHHAACAGHLDQAITCWQRAGNAALAESNFMEAAGFFDNAIELIRRQADAIDRRTLELQLVLRLGQALINAQGHDTEATKRAFERTLELIEAVPCSASYRAQAHYGLWAWHVARAKFDKSLPLAIRALESVQAGATPEALLCAHRMVGASHLYLGQFPQAREHLERVLAIVDRSTQGNLAAEFGVHHGATALCYYAWVLKIQGYAEQGRQALAQARRLGLTLHQVSARVNMHLFSIAATASVGDVVAVLRDAQSLAELAARHRLPEYVLIADAFLGWGAVAIEGPSERAIPTLGRIANDLIARGTRLWNPFLLARLAMAVAQCGRPEQARQAIEPALAELEQTGQRWCEAEVWRIRGEVLLYDAPPDRAEAASCFDRALAIARSQGAKLWELRAAVSLARLLAGQGEKIRAQKLLTLSCEWFTEGFETPDLVEARRLLSELERDLPLQSSG